MGSSIDENSCFESVYTYSSDHCIYNRVYRLVYSHDLARLRFDYVSIERFWLLSESCIVKNNIPDKKMSGML